MPEVGRTVSHYRIVEKIGQGGMGEVYLADDTTLDRKVALKFLPEAFTRETERMARFEREAKLLASLNHPNIAGIHGLEQADGNRFLVLEHVEGETLQARLSNGELPLEDALLLCRQIAEGLEAAHEKGVIHRDLKPANVMITGEERVKILDFGLAKALSDETQSIDSSQSPTLTEAMTRPGVIHRDLKPANIKVTPEGQVKVLDFGLAKAFTSEQAEMNLSNSPTLSQAATMQGVILGTAAYMSPEQARGKGVDKRADVWAFGDVLFEMVAGKQVFKGDTVSDTLASVLAREPEWESLPQNLHPRIRLLLERCLKKEIKDRYGAISDARVDIQEALSDPDGVFAAVPATPVESRSGMRTIFPWITAIILVGLTAGTTVWFLKAPEPRQVSRFEYKLPEGHRFASEYSQTLLAVSPDGRQFVYLTSSGLSLRYLDRMDAVLLIGSEEDPRQPFFSPDGKWVGYWSGKDKQLKKRAISAGAPVFICNIMDSQGAHWGEDNKIVYSEFRKGIFLISAEGGNAELLVKAEGDLLYHPQILPGGKSLLYTRGSTIVVQSLGADDRKELFPGYRAQFLATGHLIYGLENNLYAVPFDHNKLEAAGDPIPMVEGRLLMNPRPQYAISNSGTLLYIPGSILNQAQLAWCDRLGSRIGSVGDPAPYQQFSLSPDEKRAVLSERNSNGNYDLWVLELERSGIRSRFTSDEYSESDPIWSPDGNYIAFRSNRKIPDSLYRKSVAVEEEAALIKDSGEGTLIPEDWSDDFISYLDVSEKGQKICLLPLSDSRDLKIIAQGNFNYDEPKFSPDGKWLAYVSNEAEGISDVYIQQLEDKGLKRRISTKGGVQPQWREDGKELYYLDLDGYMMAVELKGETLAPGDPKSLFRTGISVDSRYDQYAVTGDGKKFLLLNPLNSGDVSSINIVLNWFEELKREFPVD